MMPLDEISRRLRAGRLVLDADFDAWLPEAVQGPSHRYWTPVGVAQQVARWLADGGASSVLDVGSGAGKFCVVGALSSALSFTGIEHRPHLVDAAEELARRCDVSARVQFECGDIEALDFARFDALYLFNPFGENMLPVSDRLDDSVEVSRARFTQDCSKVERLLGSMPVSTQLVTYNSCGGRIPDSYELVQTKLEMGNMLRLWRKARAQDEGGYWLELEETTALRRAGQFELTELKAK